MVNKRMDQYFGQQLKLQADKDMERDINEQRRYRDQQKNYFDSLNQQVRVTTKRKRVDDMMTEQERQLNNRNIQAYENMDSKRFSLNYGYNYTPKNQPDFGKITFNSKVKTDRNFGTNKTSNSQAGMVDLIAPRGQIDYKNQDRYVK